MLFKLPVASICKHDKHDKATTTMGRQNNKKSENNSIQASYDPDNKDTRHGGQ